MYCDRRGNRQKPTRRKSPGQKPTRTIEIECVQRTFVRDLCTRPTKNKGVRDVWRTFGGGPGLCDKVWQGRGSKLAKNSVTYFMDGPYMLSCPKAVEIGILIFLFHFKSSCRQHKSGQHVGLHGSCCCSCLDMLVIILYYQFHQLFKTDFQNVFTVVRASIIL